MLKQSLLRVFVQFSYVLSLFSSRIDDLLGYCDDHLMSFEGSIAERAWKSLRWYLDEREREKQPAKKTDVIVDSDSARIRVCVIEKILSLDRGIQLPPWLVNPLKNAYPERLLRVYFKFSCLEEATRLAADLLRVVAATTHAGKDGAGQRYTPSAILEQIFREQREVCDGAAKDANAGEARQRALLQELESAWEGYRAKLTVATGALVRSS